MRLSNFSKNLTRRARRVLGLSRARGLVRLHGDGPSQGLDFDLGGLEAAGGRARRIPGGLKITLPEGAAPTAARVGGPGAPLIPLKTSRLIRASARSAAAPDAGVALMLEGLDTDGAALGRLSLPLNAERRDWFVRLPDAAAGAELRMRFLTSGRLEPIDLTVVEIDVETLAVLGLDQGEGASAPQDVTAAVHASLGAVFQARNYQALIALCARPALQSDRVNRLAFASLVELRRFEDALAMPDDGAGDDGAVRRFEALANLDRWDEIEARIGARLERADAADQIAPLAAAFAFTARDADLRARVVDRIAEAENLDVIGAPLIDVANRALFMPPTPQRGRLVAQTLAAPTIAETDRLILASQQALAAGDAATQLARLNEALGLWALAPLVSTDPAAPLAMAGLDATKDTPVEALSDDAPLVSIVMTSFNSADTIGYALGSMLAQTYGRLEIIVVDDASTDATLQVVRDLDHPAVRLLPQGENRGTYACRNTGLQAATGRWVLNQDSDDWAHPQKIARLVAAMTAATTASGAAAVFGQGLRLSPDQGFQARRGFTRPDGTSLMFEREAVLARLGGYEGVRAGADGEFHRRMERVFGRDAILELDAPLSVIATRPQSLSRAAAYRIDEETGVFTPQRNAYRQDYLQRHEGRFGRG